MSCALLFKTALSDEILSLSPASEVQKELLGGRRLRLQTNRRATFASAALAIVTCSEQTLDNLSRITKLKIDRDASQALCPRMANFLLRLQYV
jgi:hypothetical protein